MFVLVLSEEEAMSEDAFTADPGGRPASLPHVTDAGVPASRLLAEDLHIAFSARADRVLVGLSGQIDVDSAASLSTALDQAMHASRTGLDIDLSGVSFCGSAGLNALLGLRLAARRTARTVHVTTASAQVERLFAITETASLFTPHAPAPAPAFNGLDPAVRPRLSSGGSSFA
ncbi:STAS domain-containing protein [Kitasatospora herbaricolor]|uniref:STAS domain-containing protein n=1 Tax=Kitasatospora herbaricolor TaxID=68217 RepID=A0ABZ1W223_9ACTN|nr:STAS domain-containing protein [Kitasatospora herbaricolor]